VAKVQLVLTEALLDMAAQEVAADLRAEMHQVQQVDQEVHTAVEVVQVILTSIGAVAVQYINLHILVLEIPVPVVPL
jgi:hypothetical protein